MATETLIETHIVVLLQDGCRVHGVAEAKGGDTVILYSPAGRLDLYARILFAGGTATKRHVNDLSLHVSPVEGAPVNAWYLQYIRILGDKINRGFGSIMLRQLLLLAEREGVAYIEGRMQQAEHREHLDRLRYFYAKFGFVIDADGLMRWENTRFAASRAASEPSAARSSASSSPDNRPLSARLHKIIKKVLHLF